jgi:hypothetical protein
MSAIQEIEVIIRPDGQVELQVRGVKGDSCVDLTRELERYLGGRVSHRQHTEEYRQQPLRKESTERNRVG